MIKRIILSGYLFFLAWVLPCRAQIVIKSFAPQQMSQGSTFTLTINGDGFPLAGAVQVQFFPGVGITVLSTHVVSNQQMTAQVQIAASAPTVPSQIRVIAGGSFATAPGAFMVTPAPPPTPTPTPTPAPSPAPTPNPPPTLTQVGPALVSPGSQNLRLILRGRSFRPGAKVVISPPLAALTSSTARQQATDVVVQSVVRVSDTLLLVEIVVGRQAAQGLRAVDVVNTDGTSTGTSATPGTSQPLNIAPNNSLAAPLSVATIALIYPRDGTVISQGDDIYGAAVLAGTGTGVLIGEWLWDGAPIEQFSVPMTGGGSVQLKTARALPSTYLGPHTLALRVNSPNQLQTRSVDLVVNPGHWKVEKLLAPPPNAKFLSNSPPLFEWVLVPGADHYQVGIAAEPFFSAVEQWHDVTEIRWRVPEEVWKGLPEGQLYWTVRVVDISGDTRRPTPMRSVWKLPATPPASQFIAPAPGAMGLLLNSQSSAGELLYRFDSSTLAAETAGQESGKSAPSPQKTDAEVPASSTESPQSQTQPSTPASASPAEQPATAGSGLQELTEQVASNSQWISGSTPDTNVMSLASRMIFHNGPWTSEINGSGLMNSILSPDPQHSLGRVNDYVLRLAYERRAINAGLRFGLLSSSLYTGSEFVTQGVAREAIETWLGTPAGKFSFFANVNDVSPGAGIGTAFHQRIRGASYDAPVPKKFAELRLMWLSARDIGGATTITFTPTGTPPPVPPPLPGFPVPPPPTSSFLDNPGAGDAYGLLLLLHLGPAWTWNSEYSLSYENPNTTLNLGRQFGRAWKSGVSGSWKKATISIAFRNVSPNFGSPANPSLTPNSNPDRRGVDASISRPFKIGTFTAVYQFLQSGVHSSTAPTLSLNSLTLGWSLNLTPATVLQLGGRDVLTRTGNLPPAVLSLTPKEQLPLRADLRDAGLNATVSHRVGNITLTAGGTRDWLRNNLVPQQDAITSGINVGANWQRSFFQINSNASVNWVAADKFTVGETRIVTAYIQPTVTWKRAGISLASLCTISNNRTLLNLATFTADNFTNQYSGRLTWQMPRMLKFSTLSLEGGQVHLSDAILNTSRTDTRLLLLWNAVWGYSKRR